MKDVLVLAGGGGSDHAVFATALGIAQPLGAHLEFFHVQVDPGEAVLWQPHAEFARGSAMREMMQRLETECVMRTAVARDNFAQFCELHGISITGEPRFDHGISAGWREEMGDADRRLIFCARHYDLVAAGRPTGPNGLPPDLLGRLLLGCGRPLLIALAQLSDPVLGTVMVCWKETAEAARAVAAQCRCWPKRNVSFLPVSKRTIRHWPTDWLILPSSGLAWHQPRDRINSVGRRRGR